MDGAELGKTFRAGPKLVISCRTHLKETYQSKVLNYLITKSLRERPYKNKHRKHSKAKTQTYSYQNHESIKIESSPGMNELNE